MPPIPKILHWVWFQLNGGSVAPPKDYEAMKESWRRLHPGWTFMDWDLTNSRSFLQRHYPQYLPMFDGYKRDIFRIDAIRYFALHHYGGFYVDTDIDCLENIESFRHHKVVLALNKYTKNALAIYNNHFMGTVPGSKFFQACIERLPTASLLQTEKSSYLSVMGTAGPFYLTTIASYHRKKGEIYTLPYETELRHFIHHECHSWKVTQNILSDMVRIGLFATATTGLVYGGLALKEAYQRQSQNKS